MPMRQRAATLRVPMHVKDAQGALQFAGHDFMCAGLPTPCSVMDQGPGPRRARSVVMPMRQ